MYDQNTKEQLLRIKVDIHKYSLENKFKTTDFSINTNFIIFYDMYNHKNKSKKFNFTVNL